MIELTSKEVELVRESLALHLAQLEDELASYAVIQFTGHMRPVMVDIVLNKRRDRKRLLEKIENHARKR